MANTNACGVWRVDTTADLASIKRVKHIKVVASAASTVVIKDKDTSGNTVYEAATSGAGENSEDVLIQSGDGLRVEVSNAVVYLYAG